MPSTVSKAASANRAASVDVEIAELADEGVRLKAAGVCEGGSASSVAPGMPGERHSAVRVLHAVRSGRAEIKTT